MVQSQISFTLKTRSFGLFWNKQNPQLENWGMVVWGAYALTLKAERAPPRNQYPELAKGADRHFRWRKRDHPY